MQRVAAAEDAKRPGRAGDRDRVGGPLGGQHALDIIVILVVVAAGVRHHLEIATGLGDLEGDIFRIGCMGYSSRAETISYLMTALGDALDKQGADVDVDAGLAATAEKLGER